MAGIDFSRPILGAGASAKTDFAAAQARTGLNFTGNARFKRGVKAELGVEAFADASAELSKFVHASIAGTAFARAKAGIQLQLPLNLFDEFGFAARAEAIAEAAAGLEANLGISIGDFVLLAKRDPALIGLPLEILLLFLEEVSIGGTFEVNVSASAKANASVTVAGTIIEKAGEKAGFFYTIDAGVGLAAGVGMGLKAGAEFRDFRRFFGRAVDKSVDTTIQEIIKLIPPGMKMFNGDDLTPWLEAFSPVAKIALRIAYDVGLKISENNPGKSPEDMAVLCDEAVKTFLEEVQRYGINKLLEFGIDSIKKLIEQEVPGLPQGIWDSAIGERNNLAVHLLNMPPEPFQDTPENILYWEQLLLRAIELINKIGNPDPKFMEAVAVIYCTSELLAEAIRAKVNVASSYALAIGAGSVGTDTKPFKGQLQNQPSHEIRDVINTTIGINRQSLTYADLLEFLVDDIIVAPVLVAFPELKQFMNVFAPEFNKAENELMKLFLQNACSFDPSNPGSAQADPHALLTLIVNSLDVFITNKFKTEVLPQILVKVSDPNLRLYIEEVLYEAVVYMKDVGLRSILNWSDPGSSFENDDFTEALAGVIMLLLGRTVVIVADTFITATQERIEEVCNDVSDKIKAGNQDVRIFNLPADPDLVNLVADCVKIGGVVLGPLPDDTRKRVRNLLYQVFEPIPPGLETDFLSSLADQFFIPNGNQLQQLTNELAAISKDRFGQFVEKFILKMGEYIEEKLEELIQAVIDLVINWEKHLADALLDLAQFLHNLEQTVRRLNQELIAAFTLATNALHSLFQVFSDSQLKSRIKADIKSRFIDKAFDALEDNDLYKALPAEWKSGARALVGGAVDEVMDNPLINPVFTAIGRLSSQLDDLLPDVRELSPDDNLPEQIMLLVLDKIEDNIREHFGSEKPHISPAIDFSYKIWEFFDWDWHLVTHHVHIPLGRIEINLGSFINLIRDAVNSLSFYHTLLNDACFKLGDALAKEIDLAANQLLQKQKKEEQDRLAGIDREHNNGPREIAILKPASLSHFTGKIDVKIHLGGVPMSFLGLDKDEVQRLLIYMNGELIPVKSLIIKDVLNLKEEDAGLIDLDFKNLNTRVDNSGKASNAFNTATGIITGQKLSIMTNTSAVIPVHALNSQKAGQGKSFPFSTSPLQEQPSSRAVYSTPVKTGSSGNSLVKTSSVDKEGRMVSRYAIGNQLPGRNITPSKINNLLQDRLEGIYIQFEAELDEPYITEGVNVLTVVVIERGGNRHQQTVSFTVSRPTALDRPVPGIIRVVDKNTGKAETGKITLNGMLNDFMTRNKDNKISESGKKSIETIVANSKNGKMPVKREPQTVQPVAATGMFKKETLAIVDKKGKVIDTNELKYQAGEDRAAALTKLGLGPSQLKRENRRLRVTKVAFEKVSVPQGSGKIKVNTLLPITTDQLKSRKKAAMEYLEKQDEKNFELNKKPIKQESYAY
jgi:hypothetical protein